MNKWERLYQKQVAEAWDAKERLEDAFSANRRLLAENKALLERLTLTPARIEAAAKAATNTRAGWDWNTMPLRLQRGALIEARAALLAAGFVEEAVTKGDE